MARGGLPLDGGSNDVCPPSSGFDTDQQCPPFGTGPYSGACWFRNANLVWMRRVAGNADGQVPTKAVDSNRCGRRRRKEVREIAMPPVLRIGGR